MLLDGDDADAGAVHRWKLIQNMGEDMRVEENGRADLVDDGVAGICCGRDEAVRGNAVYLIDFPLSGEGQREMKIQKP